MQKINIVAFDLGNGYIKRTYDGKNVLVDPAIYAPIQEQAFNLSQWESIVQIGQTKAVIGQEALLTKSSIKQITGENDFERYVTNEFQDLLVSTIIKDKKQNLLIERLVIGLPVQHQKMKLGIKLKEIFSNQQFENISFNMKNYSLHIKEVIVLPQPMGTYFKESSIYDLSKKHVLIIDGGFGTVDFTEINKERILSSDGTDNGIRKAYTAIGEQLQLKYPGAHFNLFDVEEIVRCRKVRYMGNDEFIEDEFINVVLSMQFNSVMEHIVARHNTFAEFDHVIFTGGFAHVFKEQIDALGQKYANVMKSTNAQKSNVLGYYLFGGAR